MSARDLAAWRNVAVSTARAAGQALRRRGRRAIQARSVSGKDIKIVADQANDRLIRRCLSAWSSWPVLSEERRAPGLQPGRGLWWIVDPLDGSVNYHRGIPLTCVSIALWQDMEPVLGVVYDPVHGELFSGIVGRGAWRNGAPIRVSRVRETRQAVLCTGFPVGRDYSTRALGTFVRQVQRYQKIRLLGSAALSLAYVACGRADVYSEQDIYLWDVAAGLALVRAAGGRIAWTPGRAERTLIVSAGNPYLAADGAAARKR